MVEDGGGERVRKTTSVAEVTWEPIRCLQGVPHPRKRITGLIQLAENRHSSSHAWANQTHHELIAANPIVNKPSNTKENNMSMQPTHSLREEGYCGICKRNFRDMGRHNLDLHDGRGIHAWRCLSYKETGHGGRCTYVDCNFTEMRMHYLKHHAEELECIQVKWKKGYYAVEDGHIVPGAPFYPSEHPFSAVDDPDFPARRLEIDKEKYQQAEGGATPFDPMVRPTSASAMYRMEARRWEDEAPPRKRTRTP